MTPMNVMKELDLLVEHTSMQLKRMFPNVRLYYENSRTRETEMETANMVAEEVGFQFSEFEGRRRGVVVQMNKKGCPIDYRIVRPFNKSKRPNPEVFAMMEIKRRYNDKYAFEDLRISSDKWAAGFARCMMGLPTILVIQWDDCTEWVPMDLEIYDYVLWGRTDRDDTADFEVCACVDLDEFRPINCLFDYLKPRYLEVYKNDG